MTEQPSKTEDKKIKALEREISVLKDSIKKLENRFEKFEDDNSSCASSVASKISSCSLSEKTVKFTTWLKMNPVLGACVIGVAGIILGLLLD